MITRDEMWFFGFVANTPQLHRGKFTRGYSFFVIYKN